MFSDREKLESAAEGLGFPVVMKASHGYGGIGMRVIRDMRRLETAFEHVQSTCGKFLMNSPEVFLEEYVSNARLLEFPVLRDEAGRTIVFPELECPLQRRFQKLLLETPAPHLDPDMRARLQSEVRVLCERLGIFGFASVEFLIKDDQPNFLEINGYIQPSHTATTLLTGVDLLKEQIRLLSGEPLEIAAGNLPRRQHVIATYIYAEDPENNFAPSPGIVDRLYLPFGEEVYMQTSIFSGASISPFYDPMVAKLLARGRTREDAILKMGITLDEFFVEGVRTNIPLMRGVLRSEALLDGTLTPEDIATAEKRAHLVNSLKTGNDFEIASLVAALALHRDGETLKRMEVFDTERGSESVLGAATRWLRPRKNRRSL
jgi:biotin carboxylase